MPLQTDFNIFPYHDDFDETNDFYKILFQPGVSVQVRELNQLQTILQKQIERFGDNIFKRGTIIDGCQFIFHNVLPFIKLKDADTDGTAVDVTDYVNKIVTNQNNLKAYVIEAETGFESSDPDLNTLYVRYLNSGDTTTDTSFSSGDTLTIYDTDRSIQSVVVNGGSSLLSNSDSVVFLSPLELQNSTGGTSLATSFTVGETVTQSTTGAKANVTSIDVTSNTSALVLNIRPLSNNLANGLNTAAWTFSTGYNITGGTSGAVANVVGAVGSGATGSITTDGSGVVSSITVTAGGDGYYLQPWCTVATANNAGNTVAINLLDLDARNYSARIVVPTIAASNGVGYGFSVTDGVIYQKGHFARVNQQLLIVEKYANTPHERVIGFDTVESIVNSNTDSSLFDNATGTFNYNAPGANRLKLTPELVVLDKSDAQANDEFFSLVEFTHGKPFKQNRTTEYNTIGQEMARRTFEESGDYVIDPFLLSTRSEDLISDDAGTFEIVIDPGLAYINGYRTQTVSNYSQDIRKGVDTKIVASNSVDVNYGNYIEVNELGGSFRFNLGDVVSLRDTANSYVTSYPGTTISSGPGTELGSARMRSLTLRDGVPGTPSAVYRLYLFDVRTAAGKNFRDVRSVYYAGSNKGVADVVLSVDGTTGLSVAKLKEVEKSSLIIPTKTVATKTLSSNVNSANVVYTVRFVSNSASISATGSGGNLSQQVTISNTGYGYFDYAGNLSATEKMDIIIVPQSNVQAAANISGTITVTAGQTNVTGSGTSFITDFDAADFIKVANSTALEYRRITSITNNTFLTVGSAFTNSFSGNAMMYFPANIPIPFATRDDRVASVSSNTTLYLGLGIALNVSPIATIYYNQKLSVDPSSVTKTAKRKLYVKLAANTHANTTVGPWCLGIPDIFRLRNVYVAETATVNTNSTNITNEFYIDHNQTEDYYDVGYLYQKPTSSYTITTNAVLLVELDAFTKTANGVISIDSYPINNTLALANADVNASNSTIATTEIPEVYGKRGNYYDLRDQFDFRLFAANTANIASTSSTASTNPTEPSDSMRFDTTTEKYFPAPESDVFFDVEYYLGRSDRIVLGADSNFRVIEGVSGLNGESPPEPTSAITIGILDVPPFPSVPSSLSANAILLYDTKIANERYSNQRLNAFAVRQALSNNEVRAEQPQGYDMVDIGKLERRIDDLEYYVALNLMETQVYSQVIPSSGNSAINRFKFGFFVDSFNDTKYSDLSSPAYNATVFNGQLTTKKKQINLPFVPQLNNANNASMTLPFIEYTAIQQLIATDGPITADTANTTAVQSTVCINITNTTDSYASNGSIHEITEFILSANSGTSTIYFDMFSDNDRVEVYQNTVSGFDYTSATALITHESANTLTASDRLSLTSSGVFATTSARTGPWGANNRPDYTTSSGPGGAAYWVKNAGKITWTHNPDNGLYHKIVVRKSSPSFSYRFCYPADSNTSIVTTTSPAPVISYTGRFTRKNPDAFTLQYTITPPTSPKARVPKTGGWIPLKMKH